MRYLSFLFVAFCVLLSSCHHTEEPPIEVTLPIVQEYLPVSLTFQRSDADFMNRMHELADKKYVVNDLSELPDDPIGFSDAYSNIDFKNYTLLVTYKVHGWDIETYRNQFSFNTVERKYNWIYSIGISEFATGEKPEVDITRFAILVDKLPEDADVEVAMTLGMLAWDWDEEE